MARPRITGTQVPTIADLREEISLTAAGPRTLASPARSSGTRTVPVGSRSGVSSKAFCGPRT
jgi:hypothetical protein